MGNHIVKDVPVPVATPVKPNRVSKKPVSDDPLFVRDKYSRVITKDAWFHDNWSEPNHNPEPVYAGDISKDAIPLLIEILADGGYSFSLEYKDGAYIGEVFLYVPSRLSHASVAVLQPVPYVATLIYHLNKGWLRKL